MLRAKVYISDEGYGPIVRQSAIISSLLKNLPDLEITLQTSNHFEAGCRIIPEVHGIKRFNNVEWAKNPDGTPDIGELKRFLEGYVERARLFIEKELADFCYDFVISDLVYEAFEVAAQAGVPAFGVAHFTWDWFFEALEPCPVSGATLDFMRACAGKATRLFFPPFTPGDPGKVYDSNSLEVPLIVRKESSRLSVPKRDLYRVLIVDSGASVLHAVFQETIKHLGQLSNFHFFVSSAFQAHSQNCTLIERDELFIDYIPQMDLCISRAGFNTISECLYSRTPMLLAGEAVNPEMRVNIDNISSRGLAGFVPTETLAHALPEFLPRFMHEEYPRIAQRLNAHMIPTNGAEVVAREIAALVDQGRRSRNSASFRPCSSRQ